MTYHVKGLNILIHNRLLKYAISFWHFFKVVHISCHIRMHSEHWVDNVFNFSVSLLMLSHLPCIYFLIWGEYGAGKFIFFDQRMFQCHFFCDYFLYSHGLCSMHYCSYSMFYITSSFWFKTMSKVNTKILTLAY